MRYRDGRRVLVGDEVAIASGDQRGVVVCSIEDGIYTEAHPASQCAYLGTGVMVEFENLGLIHYELELEPDLELVRRA